MKKFGLIFATSFITYPLVLLAAPYVTASLIADFVFLFFLIAVCYQLLYVFVLRRKDNIKFRRALSLMFLYITFSLQVYIVISYILIAVNGYTPTGLFGNPIGETVYGIKAITSDLWSNLIFLPLLIICAVYQIIFSKKAKKLKEDEE